MITNTPRRHAGAPAPRPAPRPAPLAPPVKPERPGSIRARAFEIYQARNGAPGDALSDWLQAERELKNPRPAA